MKNSKYALELWGWILFVVSAIFFIASSIRSGDLFSLLGSLAFFIACFFFIFAMKRSSGHGHPSASQAGE